MAWFGHSPFLPPTLLSPSPLRSLGLSGKVLQPDSRENANARKLTRAEKQLYFAQLSDRELDALCDIYQFDFLMFDYERALPQDE